MKKIALKAFVIFTLVLFSTSVAVETAEARRANNKGKTGVTRSGPASHGSLQRNNRGHVQKSNNRADANRHRADTRKDIYDDRRRARKNVHEDRKDFREDVYDDRRRARRRHHVRRHVRYWTRPINHCYSVRYGNRYYYRCEGGWYYRTYSGSSVVYIVDDSCEEIYKDGRRYLLCEHSGTKILIDY